MRLHALSLTAFGPFAGTESVDFDRLSDAGLFLLHGPTGAGKTTVLDAVSFALFGRVPGVRTAGTELRSHHAAPGTVTEVRLELTLGDARYRIVRRPRQRRPKQRGEGWREHPPQATVEQLVAGEWVARAAKPGECDALLQDHLHMEADQFHQIVMLPQGEFARFLRAGADDRRDLLEELFATHRFTRVERWLRDQADRTGVAVREAGELARRGLGIVAALAGTEAFPDTESLDRAPDWLAVVAKEAREAAARAEAEADDARLAHEAAKRELVEATDLASCQERHAVAAADRAALAARAGQHLEQVARLDAAARARALLPLLDAEAGARDRLRRAGVALDRARHDLDAAVPDLAGRDVTELLAYDEELVGRATTIEASLSDERRAVELEREMAELGDEVHRLERHLATIAAEARELPPRGRRLDDDLALARDAASRLDTTAELVDRAARRHAAAVQRDELATRLAIATDERRDRHAAALAAREHWLGLVETQLRTRAITLAETLVPGAPCPVCGSCRHPTPARGDDALVTDLAVAEARGLVDRAEAALTELDGTVAAIERDLAAAEATAENIAAGVLALEHEALGAELVALQAAAALVPDLVEAARALDERSGVLDAAADTDRRSLGLARERRSACHGAHVEATARIEAALDGFPTLAERAEAMARERALVGAVVAAERAASALGHEHGRAFAAATAAAVADGFTDPGDARRAVLDDAVIEELRAAVDRHTRDLTEAEAELGRPELVAAAEAVPVDLDAAQARAAGVESRWSAANAGARRAAQLADDLATRRRDLEQLLAELGPLVEEHEQVRHLADLANGDDRQVTNRMRLSTYVLAARLEQVAAAASERLRRMSGDRYSIVHTDETTDGRRKGGLGLRIVDAWTGTERETSSLSGGESFFTSLALALGVADVVATESGGARLDTLFIDEGFGGLDDDTLQDVMDVLDGLRAGGRAIGIVSHVGDLRTRIGTRLEVVKTPSGSTIRSV